MGDLHKTRVHAAHQQGEEHPCRDDVDYSGREIGHCELKRVRLADSAVGVVIGAIQEREAAGALAPQLHRPLLGARRFVEPDRLVHHLLDERHAVELDELHIRLDPAIQREAHFPGARKHLRIL